MVNAVARVGIMIRHEHAALRRTGADAASQRGVPGAMLAALERAKLSESRQGQSVRLPRQLRFEGTEVYVRQLGNAVLLLPLDDPWSPLREALAGFGEDFLAERRELPAQDRDGFE